MGKGTLHVVKVDLDDTESIRAAAEEVARILGNKGIDYIINNAGVSDCYASDICRRSTHSIEQLRMIIYVRPGLQVAHDDDGPFDGNVNNLMKTFATNVVGPAYVSHVFLPLLEKGQTKTIVNISSISGSIGSNRFATQTSYGISKTALNMLVRPLGLYCCNLSARRSRLSGIALMCSLDGQAGENPSGHHDHLDVPRMAGNRYANCPMACLRLQSLTRCHGCVLDMGGPEAAHPVSVGVEGILKVVASLTPEQSGKFFNFEGNIVPW